LPLTDEVRVAESLEVKRECFGQTLDLRNSCFLFCKYVAWLLSWLGRSNEGEEINFFNKLKHDFQKRWMAEECR
jgi:hypothetical protein